MRKAQSLIEYGLILALVAVIAVAATQLLGKKVSTAVKNTGDKVEVTSTAMSEISDQSCIDMGKTKYNATKGICE